MIFAIPKDLIPDWMPHCEDLIREGVETYNGKLLFDHAVRMLMSGETVLWVGGVDLPDHVQMVAFSSIVDYPNKRMLRLDMMSGKHLFEYVDEMFEMCEKYALTRECDGIEMITRRGMERILKSKGFESSQIQLEKDLWQRVAAEAEPQP